MRRLHGLLLLGLLAGLAGCGGSAVPTGTSKHEPVAYWRHRASQWVSFRNVEVRAPSTWNYDLAPAEPECIARASSSVTDPGAQDVPTHPYILVGLVSHRPGTYVDCARRPRPNDPGPAFGGIPFGLWQPHLALDVYLPHQGPEGTDAALTYRGWHLLRRTVSGIQVTVLSAPGDEAVGPAIVSSLRKVTTSTIGCRTAMPPVVKHFGKPGGLDLSKAGKVGSVAICLYSRRVPAETQPGLEASRLITGARARALTRAISIAPLKSARCGSGSLDGQRMVLRFFPGEKPGPKAVAQAYVYLDTCFRDGIMTARGLHSVTRANCAPLFAQPPFSIWAGTPGVVQLCHAKSPHDSLP